MPKITAVESQKKTLRLRSGQGPRRFNIYLDGQFAFGADEDLVVERRLVVGKEIFQEDLEKILKEAEVGKLMERMYTLFNIRARSEKEIRDYLKNLSFKRVAKKDEPISDVSIQLLIDQLKNKGLINDEQFARSWVQSRLRKYGPNRIKQELFQKGIDRETVDAVIGSQFTVHGGEAVAEAALNKKMKTWKNLDKQVLRRKAYDFLMRRGFEYSMVKEVVEKLTEELYNKN